MCSYKQTYILMCFCLQDRESELGMLDPRTKSFKISFGLQGKIIRISTSLLVLLFLQSVKTSYSKIE